MSDRGPAMVAPVTHRGEQAVQRRVGEGGPGHGSPMFGAEIPPGHAQFIARQRMVVIGSVDVDDAVWATILTGAEGFANPSDETTILIACLPAVGDPLQDAFDRERPCGMIAVDPLQGRRVRANGLVRRTGDGLVLRTEQVLRNCVKYIQKRELVAESVAGPVEVGQGSGTDLTTGQQEWIAGSDTFFIASHSPEHGADVSHRGGGSGFVTVTGTRQLSWPDYAGNSFYMTLGNLELNSACGLLFLDWERGHTLHLTGTCHVDWHDRSVLGAKRTVTFDVRRIVQVNNATALCWRFVDYSSFNPVRPDGQLRSTEKKDGD